jgi:hypothetical protein
MGVMHRAGGRSTRLLLCLVSISAVFAGLVGCGSQSSASSAPFGGCAQVVHDVPGRVVPETSGMSCAAIKRMIQAAPSEPGGYLLEGPSGVLWKCRLYRPSSPRLLLRCAYKAHRFSVLRGEQD